MRNLVYETLVIIGVLGSVTLIGTTYVKEKSEMNKKETCRNIYENVIQAEMALYPLSFNSPEAAVEVKRLKLAEDSLEDLCADVSSLRGIKPLDVNCASFEKAYRESGRPEIPAYIICTR